MEFIRKKPKPPEIQMAPFVDCVFTLIIFFLLSSNFIEPTIRMDLPKALSEQKLEKVDLVVTVDRNANVYVNRDRVPLDRLQVALQERMNAIGKFDVIFKGDEHIGYDLFVQILDIAKLAGATSFSVEHAK